MKLLKAYLFSLFIFFIVLSCKKEDDPYPHLLGDVVLLTQADVDDFGKRNQSVINGALSIGKIGGSTTITDLTPLRNITEIRGSLRIENNDSLQTLNGLENIKTPDIWLSINNNAKLTTIKGLEGLTQLKNLIISDNNSLLDLNGLENVTEVDGDLKIKFNNALISLNGLDNLTYCEYLEIINNYKLTSCEFRNLKAIKNSLQINENHSLKIIDGFNNLDDLFTINIGINDSLAAIAGFKNLKETRGSVTIGGNNLLESITGFNNLNQINFWFKLIENSNLSTVTGFNELNTIKGDLYIDACPDLVNLDGFKKIENIDRINITFTGIPNLNGFTNLKSIVSLYLHENADLTTLNGLQNITYIKDKIHIFKNYLLSDFCAIRNFIVENPGFNFHALWTNYDVTTEMIINGDCSK